MSDSRERILQAVENAVAGRFGHAHPGSFPGRALDASGPILPVDRFREVFERAGGEIVAFPGSEEARTWLHDFKSQFESVVFGDTVPDSLRLDAAEVDPGAALLGVSMARCAIAETGSLVLDARDGRRAQLLPPTQVVWIRAEEVFGTALQFLQDLSEETLPSALGLHSGPSKSADIGQIMVRGIHGPGRLIAGIIG